MMPIFDMHIHLGRSRDGAALRDEGLIRLLDKTRLTCAVVFPIDEPNPGPSYRRLNVRIATLCQKDKRVMGFCRLNPRQQQAALTELKRAVSRGLRGVKLHPRSEKFGPGDARRLMPFIERAGLPVILHTSHEPGCEPRAWQQIFLRHPKISFILAHAGKDHYRGAAEVARRCPNVYVDTSTLSLWRSGYLLKKLGPGKIVFASDAPYSHPALEKAKWNLLLGRGRTKARRQIFSENAKRILGGLP